MGLRVATSAPYAPISPIPHHSYENDGMSPLVLVIRNKNLSSWSAARAG